MKAIECSLYWANHFVQCHHRHHKPATGHKFSIRGEKDGNTFGCAIVGRPVNRYCAKSGTTLEVTRLCTDGTRNGCSFLYAAAAKEAKRRGYLKIQTYILETETGASLKAAGWTEEYTTQGGQWKRAGMENRTDQPTCKKKLWSKTLVVNQYGKR